MTKERLQMSIQTVKDNIKILEKQEPEGAGYYLQLEHEKFVLSALEKQVPKKPIYKTEELFWLCPNCDFPLPLHFKFCNDCGQALDWGNAE